MKPRRIFIHGFHLAGEVMRLQTTADAEFDRKSSPPMMRMIGQRYPLGDGADFGAAAVNVVPATLLAL